MTLRFSFVPLFVALATLFLLPSAVAEAQGDVIRRQAGEHFARGLEHFDEGRFEAALAEFQRAHELSPSPEALYNLGRVFAQLGHAVEATAAFERYLRENRGRLPPQRQREAEERLRQQRSRIGFLRVEGKVHGAVVSVDGIDRGVLPLAQPIAVSAGLHMVTIRAPGHGELRKEVRVAGGVELHIPAELRALDPRDGTLRVISELVGVEITVDGVQLGKTPLERTIVLVAGNHTVRAERPGYDLFERTVLVEQGAESVIELRLQRSLKPRPEEVGRVAIPLPDAPRRVLIDGELVELQEGHHPEVPIGPHRVRIEVAEREPYETTIDVPSSETLRLAISLEWEPDSLERRLREAREARVGRWALVVSGALVVGGAVPLTIWNEDSIRRTDAEIENLNAQCAVSCSAADRAYGVTLNERRDRETALRVVGYGGGAIGLGVAITGLILLANTPSDERIRASASAILIPTWGGLAFRAHF